MLYMTSFSTKDGRLREFQDWVKKNEDVIKKSAPRGWTYRGTYGYVLGFGRFAGAQMWECNRYGDFDAWREHNGGVPGVHDRGCGRVRPTPRNE